MPSRELPNNDRTCQTVTIPLDVAVLVVGAFLPLNPNKLRTAAPEVKAAAHAFKEAVHKAEQRNALIADSPSGRIARCPHGVGHLNRCERCDL